MALSNHLLNKTAKVYTKALGIVNDFGESSYTLSETIGELPIAFQPVKDDVTFTLRGTNYIATNVIYCNYRIDISPNDIIEVDTIQYRILSIQNDGGRNDHLRLYVVLS